VGKYLVLFLTLMIWGFSAQEAFGGEFRVYSADAYRQIEKLNAPINMKTRSNIKTQLLVDYSGSMNSWIRVAIDTLEVVLPNIARYNSVGLRTFSGRQGNGRCSNSCKSSTLISGLRRNNDAAILNGMKGLRVGGSTPIEFALRTTVAEDFAPPNIFDRGNNAIKTKKIILVTDGEESCGGDPCAYIRELMEERGDIMIDVIQLGNSDALACLADETGGRYYKVDRDKEVFEAAFEKSFELPDGSISASRTMESSNYHQRTPHYEPKKPLTKNYKFVSQE